ncbi:MAG: hypothetical protein QOK43_1669 [Acidimicrobiaceae bacterium]|jgi:hypothetical protein|nr:hypothetical protein [Acidimicrobiaceae bacterium]MDQ1443763.1 hypothetical protein [Acidimicrobiaceae bacterium]
MRQDCRHYQSRTYASGEVARWCSIDLAPDAPWRCPADCVGYERRGVDTGFVVGSLVAPQTPPEPDAPHAAELLDQAEDIVNLVGPDVLADWEVERARQDASGLPFWKRLFKRNRPSR